MPSSRRGCRRPGGEYVYLRTAFGPMAGFLYAWTTLLVVHAGGMAAVSIVFARYLAVATGGAPPAALVIVLTLALLAAINCLGVRAGSALQSLAGVAKIAAIGLLVGVGLAFGHAGAAAAPLAAADRHDSLATFAAALVPVVFSYGGWQTASYVAGEIKGGGGKLAAALMIGVAAVGAIYLLVNLAFLRRLGFAGLAASDTPAAEVLARAAGPASGRMTAAMIALSAFGFLSQSMMTGPRLLFAVARDGLLPRLAARLDGGTPRVAIGLLAVWVGVLALSGAYDRLLAYVTAMNVLFFGASGFALIVLRRRPGAGAANGFHCPGHPWTTIAFVAACAAIVAAAFASKPVDSAAGLVILLIGAPLYWLARRWRLARPGPE